MDTAQAPLETYPANSMCCKVTLFTKNITSLLTRDEITKMCRDGEDCVYWAIAPSHQKIKEGETGPEAMFNTLIKSFKSMDMSKYKGLLFQFDDSYSEPMYFVIVRHFKTRKQNDVMIMKWPEDYETNTWRKP